MSQAPRHKVFISYHHDEDQECKNRFVEMMGSNIIDGSVDVGDIVDSHLPLDEVRRRIRDDFIADATVTVVLIGRCTWKRKHVDWEIGSSLGDTEKNPRCGLLGILLPKHPDFKKEPASRNPRLIPPRLVDNCKGDDPYAYIYRWSGSPNEVNRVRQWIHRAFKRRKRTPDPNNKLRQFRDNRKGKCSRGWQD